MIGAVLLAAGESRRMGSPKLALPWRGDNSLIATLANTFLEAGTAPVIVVTGGNREAVERTLDRDLVRLVYNADYARDKMLGSIGVGLRALDEEAIEAAFVCPGDLPLLRATTVRGLRDAWEQSRSRILAPSFERRRGHPILLAREVWPEVLAMGEGQTLRDYLGRRAEWIEYVETADPGILKDIDSPRDYEDALEEEAPSQ